ncbi:MAG: hypothetical protein WBC44_21215 [Planctomycetaceae bacterium]
MLPHRAMGPALAVLALAAAAQAQENDLSKFVGVWTVTAAELGGQKDDGTLGLKDATFEFGPQIAKFTQKGEDGKPVTDEHPFKVDVKSNRIVLYQHPPAAEPNPDDGADAPPAPADPKVGMQRGIYKFSGTSLFLCLTKPDAAQFPTEFTSGSSEEGKEQFLMLKLERTATAGRPAAGARQ